MHHHYKLCELLGIQYPIILGGMAWAGTPELAAAVSNAGGLGLIGAGIPVEELLQFGVGKIRIAVCEGEVDKGSMPTGQVAGIIQSGLGVKELIERMVREASKILSSFDSWYEMPS